MLVFLISVSVDCKTVSLKLVAKRGCDTQSSVMLSILSPFRLFEYLQAMRISFLMEVRHTTYMTHAHQFWVFFQIAVCCVNGCLDVLKKLKTLPFRGHFDVGEGAKSHAVPDPGNEVHKDTPQCFYLTEIAAPEAMCDMELFSVVITKYSECSCVVPFKEKAGRCVFDIGSSTSNLTVFLQK